MKATEKFCSSMPLEHHELINPVQNDRNTSKLHSFHGLGGSRRPTKAAIWTCGAHVCMKQPAHTSSTLKTA